ncbi:N-acetylmuramic acid 6-phosphate etherase [Streptomyces griseoluteus]|uniref:N-acetylmuramic acid 6-phosphate etherase n=1 Tax=Streptomyces griseoluteus TaxID=29306 RepID=UPI003811FC2C
MHPHPPRRIDAPTERRNPRTLEIDDVSTLDALRLLNAEDRTPAEAVAAVLPVLARLVDETARRIGAGGRLHYFGAGTSGRLAVMDAAELIPTFGLKPGIVVAHHAGGMRALVEPVEGLEDQESAGAADAADVGPEDVAVGIAASGRTPYVGGALRTARAAGAFTALVSANPEAELADQADLHLGVDTGPEAIAGSTRLKAATAHKMLLNNLSTAVMVAQGLTYSNLMVDVTATNEKLRGRVLNILMEATGREEEVCATALAASAGDLKTALVGLLADCSPGEARTALEAGAGNVRAALRTLG